ncbi:MAG: amidohydrolase family protein [Thainema sp.]
MDLDLKITRAIAVGYDEPQEIAIADGRIVDVAPQISASAAQLVDAQNKLVIPGLVDSHIHLDKALLLSQYPAQEGTFAEALEQTLRLKQQFTPADIHQRACRILESAIAFGVTAMRSHVEVDPVIGLMAMETLLPLQQKYDWGITLQIAAFAQEGISNQPGTEDLLRQALSMGADLVGSAPYVDPDPVGNIRTIFDIAQDVDCDVDFHLDFLDNDDPMLVSVVIEETLRRGWQGRVCLGHMTRLAGLSPAELDAIAAGLRAAGISILALPASDLYMMSRADTHNVRRGVAPIHYLIQQGVNAGIATNNVQNLFTPFGDGDVLKIATLIAQVLQLGTTTGHELCLEMATTRAAQAIGVHNYGIAAGCAADLVILDATSASEAVATAPASRTTIKRGKVVAQTSLQKKLLVSV